MHTKVQSWLATAKRVSHVGSQITADDVITHNLLYDAASNSGFGGSYHGWMNGDYGATEDPRFARMGDTNHSHNRIFSRSVGGAGQMYSGAKNIFKRAEIENEMPILQAILLAVVLALGPLVILLGMIMNGSGIGVIFSYYFLVGSLLFLTFIERFLRYLEVSLHASQSYGIYALGNNAALYNVFTKLYFFAPLLYLGLMSLAGIRLGQSVNEMFSKSTSGSVGDLTKLIK